MIVKHTVDITSICVTVVVMVTCLILVFLHASKMTLLQENQLKEFTERNKVNPEGIQENASKRIFLNIPLNVTVKRNGIISIQLDCTKYYCFVNTTASQREHADMTDETPLGLIQELNISISIESDCSKNIQEEHAILDRNHRPFELRQDISTGRHFRSGHHTSHKALFCHFAKRILKSEVGKFMECTESKRILNRRVIRRCAKSVGLPWRILRECMKKRKGMHSPMNSKITELMNVPELNDMNMPVNASQLLEENKEDNPKREIGDSSLDSVFHKRL